MNNTLICKPVMLPARSNKGILWKTYNSAKITNHITADDIEEFYHLYLVSDREIEEGDYYYHMFSNTIKKAIHCHGKSTHPYPQVEATTDPSLGISLISAKWIEEVFVPANGKINEVKILKGAYTDIYNEVIITPTKESWTRDEVREIARVAHNTSPSAYISFDEWFDTNY